jgi:hypothetical protein
MGHGSRLDAGGSAVCRRGGCGRLCRAVWLARVICIICMMGKIARTPDEKAFDAQVGQRILRLRRLRGLSQADLGGIIGRSAPMIGRVESGKNALPTYLLHVTAEALDVNIMHIVSEPGDDVKEWVGRILKRAGVQNDDTTPVSGDRGRSAKTRSRRRRSTGSTRTTSRR